MSEFENGILGLIPAEEWLDVGTMVARPTDPIDSLMADEKTDNIMARWESIAAEYQVPLMAQFHGFDTEAQQTFRAPVDTRGIEKGLIKVKLNQSERLRAILRSGVKDEALYDYVMNDGIRLADQVVTRSKVAKNEVLATGQLTIKENNLDLTVDYGVPSAQKNLVLDFGEGADDALTDQIEAIVTAALNAGITLSGIYTSRAMLNRMRSNASIQKAINGSLMVGQQVSRDALENFLSKEYGIDKVDTNDLTYGIPNGFDANGRPQQQNLRYYPKNKVTFYGTNNGAKLGSGLWGDPPETDVQQLLDVSGSSQNPYVFITQWAEHDPAVVWTKASGLFIPVLYNPNSLFIATAQETPAGA